MAEAVVRTRPAFWRDVRFLRFAGQIAFVLVVAVVFQQMYFNAAFELDRQGVELSYDFLQTRAGIPIKSQILDYSANNNVLRAFMVGATNALLVAFVGIVLATILGVLLGIARLSPNWLLRKITQVYVEIARNVPLLVQVIFWYSAVILSIPKIQDSVSLFNTFFISNRAAAIPTIRGGGDFGAWWLIVLVGLIVAGIVWRRRNALNERTGRPSYRWSLSALTVVAVGVVGYLILGDAFSIQRPEIGAQGRNYEGGLQMIPELAGILFALVIYTATFIGEIVRGSILAVSKGQKEAAAALGLRPAQQMRFVVLPQAMRIAVPAINNQYLNLWKNTSLAFAIGYSEIINVSSTITNQRGAELQVFSLVILTYLVVSLGISLVMNVVNRAVALKGARR